MKNKLFTLLFTFIIFSGYAQMTSGTKMIGGTAGLSVTKDKHKVGNTTRDGYSRFNFSLNPNFGIFVIDQLAIGGRLYISTYSSKYKDSGDLLEKYSGTAFTIGPWIRYYLPVGTKSAFFGEFNTAIGVKNSKTFDENRFGNRTITDPTHSLLTIGIGPGYTYFITPNIGLEGLLQYRFEKDGYTPNGRDERVINKTGGVHFNIGVQAYF